MWPFSSAREKENKRLLQLQQMTVQNSPSDRLIMPKEKLMELAFRQADNAARIIKDCIRLIQNTRNPETRASRLHLLQDQVTGLERFNKYLDNRYSDLLRDARAILKGQ